MLSMMSTSVCPLFMFNWPINVERFFRQLGGMQFSGFCSFGEVTIEEFENKSGNTNWPLGQWACTLPSG